MTFLYLQKPEKYYFIIALVLKLILSVCFASSIVTQSFLPFITYYTDTLNNPYHYFGQSSGSVIFPYPALMLYLLSTFKLLANTLFTHPITVCIDLLIYRFPLLIADILIFAILASWLKTKKRKLILYYWLSPVLIYITYVYGQVDVIPIAFIFGSLYFIFKEKWLGAAILLGCGVATKLLVFLVFPFFLLYLVSRSLSFKRIALFFLIASATFIGLNLPFLNDPYFLKAVFNNSEQWRVLQFYIPFNNVLFYLIPASLVLLFTKSLMIKVYNKNVFIMLLGFSFGIILLFLPPMPGWYYWLIPFFAYFYIKEETRSVWLIISLQVFYFLYFIFSKNFYFLDVFHLLNPVPKVSLTVSSFLIAQGVSGELVENLAFTLLQTFLLVNCFWIYKRGLESYQKHKIVASPFLIGIGGNSGVGKSTLSQAFEEIFEKTNTTILRGDDMHKWERGHENWQELTHLNPKANHLHAEVQYLKNLRMGRKIYRRHYDHETGKFTPKLALKPNNITIFEGLHPFYLEQQRKLYDLKIFIKPEEQLMYHWKIKRDVHCRGYSKELVLEKIKQREVDSRNYIDSQSEYADILIEQRALHPIKNLGDPQEDVATFFILSLTNSICLEPLLDKLMIISGLRIEHHYGERDVQTITIDGEVEGNKLLDLQQEFIPGLEEIGVNTCSWPAGIFGVILLILVYYIFEEADGEQY